MYWHMIYEMEIGQEGRSHNYKLSLQARFVSDAFDEKTFKMLFTHV